MSATSLASQGAAGSAPGIHRTEADGAENGTVHNVKDDCPLFDLSRICMKTSSFEPEGPT